jgi:hypothetical protein
MSTQDVAKEETYSGNHSFGWERELKRYSNPFACFVRWFQET